MPVAHCTFRLNGEKTSWLYCDGYQFKAFSGSGGHEDRPEDTALVKTGPIPRGRYYIVDRESGGHLGWLYDWVHNQISGTANHEWFALYRYENGSVSDTTFVNGVQRGQFRLHPIGNGKTSKGCITLTEPSRYWALRTHLKNKRGEKIPRTSITYYGILDVE